MLHLPHLITDLGLILVVAAITTLLFKILRQPIVLGYIIAGFFVGPHFNFVPTVSDIGNIQTWAEVGVIFLMFSLGIEFSFKKLMKVGGPSTITAVFEVLLMLAIGYSVGKLFGWSDMDSIFLGGILSISSTTIIIRAFEELGIKKSRFANLVFGILIIEDLVAILILALLSTIAASQQFAGEEMLYAIGRLLFFLVLWFIAGIFLIPTLLKRTERFLSDETLLVISLALCLGMVFLVTEAGFSAALGAFIMGAIIAETPQAERIEHITRPIKELFGAVFFVSVGMLIDPGMLSGYFWPIVIISLVTIFGKVLSTATGALFSGQPLQIAVQSGLSLAQIGEFSFIIATLGLSLKVTSDFLYPIAVAVSAITTFTTPYFIRASDPIYKSIEKRLPKRWVRAFARPEASVRPSLTKSEWQIFLRSYLLHVAVFSIILSAMIWVVTRHVFTPGMESSSPGRWIVGIISLLIMAPFVWGLSLKPLLSEESSPIWLRSRYRGTLIALQLLRMLMGFAFFVVFLTDVFPANAAIALLAAVVLVFVISFDKIKKLYDKLESRFLTNLNERDILEAKERGTELAPWDAHITYFDIKPESEIVGKTLAELALREKTGINVARIKRGSITLTIPRRDTIIYPFDRVYVIGTDKQIEKFSDLIEPNRNNNDLKISQEISLNKVIIQPGSVLNQKTIRNSGIQQLANGIVVGIERKGKRMLNPDSGTVIQPGDIIWIVGERKKIEELSNENSAGSQSSRTL